MALKLTLNGRLESVDGLTQGASLAAAIEAMGLKSDRVAVEWNGKIVARAEWAGTSLADGDKLEVVHFVGGGRK